MPAFLSGMPEAQSPRHVEIAGFNGLASSYSYGERRSLRTEGVLGGVSSTLFRGMFWRVMKKGCSAGCGTAPEKEWRLNAADYLESTFWTAATTLSTFMPSSSRTCAPGAEKPKRLMPTASPWQPRYFHQRSVTPASTETLFAQEGGSTLSRYSADCLSKRKKLGMETTRIPSPVFSAAFRASSSSEPLARIMAFKVPCSFRAT